MKFVSLLLLICLTFSFMGCAGSKHTIVVLPDSYGPLTPDMEALLKAQEAVEDTPGLVTRGDFTLPEIRNIARKTRLAPVAVAKCDIKVIRIFLASDWVPMVVIGPPRGPKNLRAIIGYDESTQEVVILNPKNGESERMNYPQFLRLWVGPNKTCLLIFSRFVGEEPIRRTLKNYLPEDRVDSIVIWTPRVR